MSGVCKKHERYIPEGEECPYCEPVAAPAEYVPIDIAEATFGPVGTVDEALLVYGPAVRLAACEEAIRAGTITTAQAIRIILNRKAQ